jgi:putative ABC transport system permease protein
MTMVEVRELMERAERTGRETAGMLKLVAAAVVGAGLSLLFAVTGALRVFREREIGMLRAIGARPGYVAESFWVEYFSLGGIAGLIGAVVGCGATSLVLSQIIGEFIWVFDGWGIVEAIALSAVLAAGVGVAGSLGLIRQTPLTVLRRL